MNEYAILLEGTLPLYHLSFSLHQRLFSHQPGNLSKVKFSLAITFGNLCATWACHEIISRYQALIRQSSQMPGIASAVLQSVGSQFISL